MLELSQEFFKLFGGEAEDSTERPAATIKLVRAKMIAITFVTTASSEKSVIDSFDLDLVAATSIDDHLAQPNKVCDVWVVGREVRS